MKGNSALGSKGCGFIVVATSVSSLVAERRHASRRISSSRPVEVSNDTERVFSFSVRLIRHTAPARRGHNAVLGNKLQRYGFPLTFLYSSLTRPGLTSGLLAASMLGVDSWKRAGRKKKKHCSASTYLQPGGQQCDFCSRNCPSASALIECLFSLPWGRHRRAEGQTIFIKM